MSESKAPSSPFRRVLYFVCTSNVCRSPVAEGIAKHWLANKLGVPMADLEKAGYVVKSGAITDSYEPPGSPASQYSIEVLKELLNVDISGHRSTLLNKELVLGADRIFGVTRSHAQHLQLEYPMLDAEKVTSLVTSIHDPWHQPKPVYVHCVTQMLKAVPATLERDWDLIKPPTTVTTAPASSTEDH